MDHVDKIIEQWNQQRPDLNVNSMRLIGRLNRITQYLNVEMIKTFKAHDLNPANFDLLATLRRAGAPYQLSPNALLASTMVTSGTMTNRIDQLIKAGLVKRVQNHNDRRSVLVCLTTTGFDVIEAAVTDHVATQDRLTSSLSVDEQQTMNRLLKKYLNHFEGL